MCRLTLSLLLFLSFRVCLADSGTSKVPYYRRSVTNADGTINEQQLFSSLSRTLVKYGQAALPENLLSRRATGTLSLTDQVDDLEDELYYGNATVGSQHFTIDFDTGSADLFVPGPTCTTADGCRGPTYYSNSGQDQHRTTNVIYGSGEISGNDYKDAVTVAGLTVPSQGFISLTDASGFASAQAQGLMGMAFSTIAETGYQTFVGNLIAEGKLTKPEFSFYLGRALSNTQKASELTIGGADTSRYTGTPKTIPVTRQGYWQVALDAVNVNGKSAGATTNGQAAIDTGTTIVLAPTVAAKAIFSRIPGAKPLPLASGSASLTLYAYPCNTAARYIPSFQFAGSSFAINPKDFNLGCLSKALKLLSILGALEGAQLIGSSSELCLAGVAAADVDPTENLYVVGDVFLKNWYSTFSYTGASVSFAPAVHNNP